MSKKTVAFLLFSLALAGMFVGALLAAYQVDATSSFPARTYLTDGWAIQSSTKVKAEGAAIGSAGYDVSSWFPATAPSTVLAALVAAGEYDDPFFGVNLKKLPGTLPPPFDISASRTPLTSPFAKAWWYRAEFELPPSHAGKRTWLAFDGINYRANLWVNGKQIADAKQMVGAYRRFEFDVTDYVVAGKPNSLALEVFGPKKRELALTWVDWNPAPPDRDMGVWRRVSLAASGPVRLRYPHVVSDLPLPALDSARLTVSVEATNASREKVTGVLRGTIGAITFEKQVKLAPGATDEIKFTPEEFSQLVIAAPKLWWPYQLGEQNLHDLKLSFTIDGEVSDRASARFGIREIADEMSDEGYLILKVNGQRVLVRGAGWAPDMMLRQDPSRLAAEIRYVKEMNMNSIRLEGKLETEAFYDLCDREGILVIAGWCCCHHWEHWRSWDDEDYQVAEQSQRDQIKRLRSRASLLLWMNGSDNPPPIRVERVYLDVLEQCRWPNAVVSSATEQPADVSGPSGVKMNGPYEYVPPVYWYADPDKYGGAWGFNTETSPGPAVPPVESLERMLGPDHLWPIDSWWNYHAGRNMFGNIGVYTKALNARYGPASGVEEFAIKSQAMSYEGQRAMMEAFGRNKYEATGVIQWMLNDAWPSIIWHLYDYYLRPGGGYFGTQKACEPLHAQFSYDDRSVVVVNSRHEAFGGLTVKAAIHDFDMSERWSEEMTVDVGADGVARVMTAPEPAGVSETYFLKLWLRDAGGSLVSENFYWLSTREDVPNWIASQWHYTPVKEHADYGTLNNLPAVELEVGSEISDVGDEREVAVSLRNGSPHLAFMVRLQVQAGGEEVLPVFWEDNYFSMLPGEERVVKARVRDVDAGDGVLSVEVSGWNVK